MRLVQTKSVRILVLDPVVLEPIAKWSIIVHFVNVQMDILGTHSHFVNLSVNFL